MTEQQFQSEMRRVETMRRLATDPMQSDYYAGYIRGLRRAYHGENFGTPQEHDIRIALVNSEDESQKKQGLGYRDGLAFSPINSPAIT
jgi:hypothetical protein